MPVPGLERSLGIEVYATSSPGIGGAIRRHVEDFAVEEVLVDGSKAEIDHPEDAIEHSVLGSSLVRNDYLLCVLVKRNWDTISVSKAIADQIGLGIGRIQVAGLKDAKAVTAQHITIEDVDAETVHKVRIKDVRIHPIGYFHSRLSSYYLLGNSFRITINAIKYSKSTAQKRIAQVIEELKSNGGVPNFFGHQRFGTVRPITHLVGKAIAKERYEAATMLFLAKPSRHEHPASRDARKMLLATQDFEQAYRNFPKQLRYERLMLACLAKEPNDYVGAFCRLPTKLRELFLQAYQSYLFNKSLSRRITMGHRLDTTEVGDHVVSVERSGLPMVAMHKMVSVENRTEINRAISAGKMRLALPLVGFKQHLSSGAQGEIEKQIINEEGISLKNFGIAPMPEISLRGGLRTAITPLKDFSLGKVEADPTNLSEHKAEVSFTLNRGSYATIILRELMKPRNLVRSGF